MRNDIKNAIDSMGHLTIRESDTFMTRAATCYIVLVWQSRDSVIVYIVLNF